MNNLFRALPAVDGLLQGLQEDKDLGALPRAMLRDLVNEFLDVCREEIKSGAITDPADLDWTKLGPRLIAFVRLRSRPHFRRVLNATGVVIHTNLGLSLIHI